MRLFPYQLIDWILIFVQQYLWGVRMIRCSPQRLNWEFLQKPIGFTNQSYIPEPKSLPRIRGPQPNRMKPNLSLNENVSNQESYVPFHRVLLKLAAEGQIRWVQKARVKKRLLDPSISLFSRWWLERFSIFTPIPGEMIQFDEHIFQMGWSHRLVLVVVIIFQCLASLSESATVFSTKVCQEFLFQKQKDLAFVPSVLRSQFVIPGSAKSFEFLGRQADP